jgi:dTDP-4-amino-4,6-dideoxygalactose transaminase
MGTYSFHETKNYTAGGEGGLLIVNDGRFAERAEIIREKGTNRSQFFRGMVDKYTWVDVGSSYLPADINAAYLYAQLETADVINADRLESWQHYIEAFATLAQKGVDLPTVPSECEHNAHMFYLKCRSFEERTALLEHCKTEKILAVFHYIPLHTSPAGRRFSRFHGEDRFTTVESERLIRLPLYYGMDEATRQRVIDVVRSYYGD